VVVERDADRFQRRGDGKRHVDIGARRRRVARRVGASNYSSPYHIDFIVIIWIVDSVGAGDWKAVDLDDS
jgi:hypothetical protein